MKVISVMVLPLLLAAHGLTLGGIDEGVAAYNRGDYDTALWEWRSLAEQGNERAQYNLGLMYEGGYGVLKNNVQAHMWYDIAGVEVAVSYRDYVAREMTSAQVAEAKKLARLWMGKHLGQAGRSRIHMATR